MRDLVLDVPVFWIEQPAFILICVTFAALVFFGGHLIESRYKLLLWLDAVALAAYGVFGAYKGLLVTGSATVAVVMGMITGTLGGIIRDVLAGEPSVLMRPEIYVAAAMAGAVAYVALYELGLPHMFAAGAGFLVAFVVRGGALHFRWNLPSYKSRPGRDPKDLL